MKRLLSFLTIFLGLGLLLPIHLYAAPPVVSNLRMTGAMEGGFTLEVFYDYFDPDGHAESGTTFQWYTHPDRFSPPGAGTPIPGATGSTFTIPDDDSFAGLHISVIVTPRDSNGEVGTPVEYMDWSPSKDNPVLRIGSSCQVAGDSGPVTPDNGFLTVEPLCSPRDADWRIRYTGIDYRFTNTPIVLVDWGDGNTDFFFPTLLNPNETKMGLQQWEVIASHTYDYDGGSNPPADGSCTYELTTAYGVFAGGSVTLACPPVIAQEYIVWDDIDNDDLGDNDINHDPTSTGGEVGETVEVCENDTNPIRLVDASTFNCTPPIEVFNPNEQTRWVQWVYGSNSNITTGTAPDELIYINGVGYTAAQLPVYGEPQLLAGPVTVPNSITDDIQMPTTAVDGEIFEVTLRSWNTCNPFSLTGDNLLGPQTAPFNVFNIYGPGGTVQNGSSPPLFANSNPIPTEYTIVIVEQPLDPIAVDKEICHGATLPAFEITFGAASSQVNWYEDNAGIPGAPIPTTNNNSQTLPPADYQPVLSIDNTVAGVYTVWASYVANTGSQDCESNLIPVEIRIREELEQLPSGSISSSETFPVCATSANFTFSVPDETPQTNNPGGDWIYEWQFGGGSLNDNLNFVGPTDGRTVTVEITNNNASGNRRVRVRKRYVNNDFYGNNCAPAFRDFDFTIDAQSLGGQVNGGTDICSGEPTGNIVLTGQRGSVIRWFRSDNGGPFTYMGNAFNNLTTISEPSLVVSGTVPETYTYRAEVSNGVCNPSQSLTTTFTVYPIPTVPTITTSAGTDLCEDISTTLTANSNAAANSFQWYRNGVAIPGETNSTIVLGSVSESGDYSVEAFGINPTDCPSGLSTITTININPLPTANISGGGSVCSGTPGPPSVITMTGVGPFNITYERDGNPFTVSNITSPYVIPGSTTVVDGTSDTFVITSITDLGTTTNCTVVAPSSNISGTSTIANDPTPPPSVDNFSVGPAVCNDGFGTSLPTISLDLAPDLVSNYDITFEVRDGSSNLILTRTINKTTDASGLLTFNSGDLNYADLGNVPDTYELTLTSIINTGNLCNASGLPVNQSVIINIRPADPTGPVDAIACSSDPTGATLSVDVPPADTEITWYSDVALTTPASGTTSGSRQNQFTPTANATATYYAVVESTTTGCQSVNSVAVQHTTDQRPDPADADQDDDPLLLQTCNDQLLLGATPVNNGGSGTWSYDGLLYFEDFNSLPNATSFDNDLFGWSLNINSSTIFDVNTYFEVRNNMFEGRDLDAENDWISSPIDISTVTEFDISVDVSQDGGTNYEGTDYVRVHYRIDGGALQLVQEFSDDFGSGTATANNVPTGGGNTLEIVILVQNNAIPERLMFDNIIVRNSSAPLNLGFNNINNPNATVSGLPVGNTTLTWTATSALGACPSSFEDVTVIRNPLPDAFDPAPVFCEDLPRGSDNVAGVDLTTFNDAITGITGSTDRTIEFFDDPSRNPADLITNPNNINVSNNQEVWTIVTNTVTGCTSEGIITFTVNTLPDTEDQTAANNAAETVYCEETVGSGNVNDIDLTILNDNVAAGVTSNRTVTWYGDPGTPPITPADLVGFEVATENDVDNIQDGDVFYAVVQNSTTLCQDIARVTFTVNPRPLDNAIGTPENTFPTSYTVCRSPNLILFQVDDSRNPGSTYTWNVPTGAGEFNLFAGGGPNDSFIIIIANDAVPSPGLPITVQETSPEGCTGVVNTINIIVDDAPPAPVITGPADVCSNQQNVEYRIASPLGGSTYTWNVPGTLGSIVSGQGTDRIIVNIGSTSGNITVTETSSSGCVSPPASPYPVTVNPRPSMSSPTSATICSGETVNGALTLASTIPGSTFNWEVISRTGSIGGTTVGETGAGQIPHTLTNVSGAQGSITYQVVPTSPDGCAGTGQVVVITVNPEPVGGNDNSFNACSNTPINYDLQNNVDNLGNGLPADFDWIATDNPNVTGETTVLTAGDVISDVLINTTGSTQIVEYTITPTDEANNCIGAPFTVRITVFPEPVGTNDNIITCSNDPVSYNLQNNINGNNGVVSNFTWVATSNPDVSGETTSIQNTGIINDNLVNTTDMDQVVTYTVTPVSVANGCAGTPFTVNVTVNPEPLGITETLTLCSDTPNGITLSTDPNSAPVAFYNIQNINNNGLTASAGNPVVNPNAGANEIADDAWTNTTNANVDVVYTIVPVSTVDFCEGTPFTVTLTIQPEPVGQVLTPTVCSDEPLGVTLSTIGTSITAATFNIVSINDNGLSASAGNPVVATGVADGELLDDAWTNTSNAPVNVVYTIEPVSADGCVGGQFTVTATINPEPVGLPQNVARCSDETLGVTLNTNGTSVPADSYNIVSIVANGLTASAGSPTVANGVADNELIDDAWRNTTNAQVDVIYTIVPVSAIGCEGDPFTVTVTVNPEPVGVTETAVICSDETLNLTLSTNGVSIGADTYNITSIVDNGLVASAGTPTTGTGFTADVLEDDAWTNTTTNEVDVIYTIVPVSAGCEGNPFTVTVTVRPEPVGIAQTVIPCSDESLNVILSSEGFAVTASTYNITNINTNGLTASAGNPVPVNGATANILNDDAWTNTSNAPVNVVYTIVPVSSAGCEGDPFTVTATINPEPVTNDVVDIVCSDEPLGVTLTTNGTSVLASTYNILSINNNGLTSSAGVPTVGNGLPANELADDQWTNTTNGAVDVIYTMVPVSADGCEGDPFTVTVTIRPEPVGVVQAPRVCSDQPLGITLNTNGTSVGAASYNVTAINSNGLTASAGSPTVTTGLAAGDLADDAWTNASNGPVDVVYTIVPVSSDNCLGDPFNITVTVDPEPIGTPINVVRCSDEVLGITLSTDGSAVNAVGYNITAINANGLTASAGSPGLATNAPANVLANDAWTNTSDVNVNVIYTVVPVSVAGCEGDPFQVSITVQPEPVGVDQTTTVCSDLPIGIVMGTNGTSIGANNYNVISINANGLTASAGSPAVANGVSNNAIADDAWTNQTLAAVDVIYTIVPVSGDNCQGDPFTVVATIDPEPVGQPQTPIVCSDEILGINLSTDPSAVGAVDYNITSIIDNGLIASAGSPVAANNVPATEIADDAWTNQSNAPVNVIYNVVPVGPGGCLGDAYTITVTVRAEPVGVDQTTTVCSDAPLGITLNTNGTSVAAANYNVTNINPNGLTASAGSPSTATGVSANVLADDEWTNTTNAQVDVIYTLVPVSANGCEGDPFTVTATIDPEPVGQPLMPTVCSDTPLGITLNTNGTSVAAANYNIANIESNGLVASAGSPAFPAFTQPANVLADDEWTNTTGAPVNVVYTVVPISAVGCLGDPFNITVTVDPEPVGVAEDINVCSDIQLSYDLQNNINTLGNGLTADFQWVAADNPNVTGESTTPQAGPTINDEIINLTPVIQLVQYTVTPTESSTGCAGDPFIINVRVDPEPVGVDEAIVICSGENAQYDLQNNINTLGNNRSSNFVWVAAGVTGVTGESTTPQSGSEIDDVLVNLTSADINVVYTVTPTGTNGCLGETFEITVTVQPEPVGFDDIIDTCSDVGISYNLQDNVDSPSGNNVASTFIWQAASNPSVTGESTTPQASGTINDILNNVTGIDQTVVYTVTPTSAAGCDGDPFTVSVIVHSEPVGVSTAIDACSDDALNYSLQNNVNSLGNGMTSSFVWQATADNPDVSGESFASAQSGSNITDVLVNNSGTDQVVTYNVTPTETGNGCVGNPFTITVTVYSKPQGVNDITTVCSDETINYDLQDNLNNLGNGLISTFTWVATDNAFVTGESLSPQTGNLIIDDITNTTNIVQVVEYTVTPVDVANNCTGDPFIVEVRVTPEPVMDPALANINVCSREQSGIILGTSGGSVAASTYDVTVISQDAGLTGTPTTGTGLVANALENDSYENYTSNPLEVVYQVIPFNGTCPGDPFLITLTVDPEPVLNPNLSTTICSDDITNVVLSTNGTSIAASSYRLISVTVDAGLTPGSANTTVSSVGSPNLIRNDTYNNLTSGALTVTYEIQPISVGPLACLGEIEQIVVTVNPEPILDPNLNPTPVCSDEAFGQNLGVDVGSVPAATYDIVGISIPSGLIPGPNNTSIGPGQLADALALDSYTNTLNVPRNVVYNVIPVSADGCRGDQSTVTFQVNPAPALADIDETVCSGDAVGVVLATRATSTTAAQYDIIDIRPAGGLTPDGGNVTTGLTADINYLAGDIFENPTNDPLTVEYDVVPVSGAGCRGPLETIVVTVEPQFIATPTPGPTNLCSGETTSIRLISPSNPTSGDVVFNYSAVASSGLVSGFIPAQNNLPEGNFIEHTIVNNDIVPHTVTYTIIPVASGAQNGGGCTGTPFDIVVTVEPRPALNITNNAPTICSGELTSLELTTGVTPSTGTVQFRLDNVSFGGTITGFTPAGTIFNNGDVIDDALVNGDPNPVIVTYRFIPLTSDPLGIGGNCTGQPVEVSVTVNPEPAVVPSETNIEICSGDFINVTLTEPRGINNVLFRWTVVDNPDIIGESDGFGNVLFQSLRNTSTQRQTIQYIVTPEVNGCQGAPEFIDVAVDPIPNVILSESFVQICEGDPSQPFIYGLNGDVANTTFNWTASTSNPDVNIPVTSGSGTNGDEINMILSNSGALPATVTFTITPVGPGSTGCTGISQTVFVSVGPRITGQFRSPDVVKCNDNTPTFLSMEFEGIPPFEVVVNDGTNDIVLSNLPNFYVFEVNPTQTTTYTITSVTDANGCTALPANQAGLDQDVEVLVSNVDATFSVANNEGCSPLTVSFTYNQVADVTYTWQWFDGSGDSTYTATTTQNNMTIQHTFENFSTGSNLDLDVRLTATLPPALGSCVDIHTENVIVYPIIRTNVVPEGPTTICSGDNIIFSNFTLGASSHRWFYRRQGVNEEIDIRTSAVSVNYEFFNTSTENPIIYELVYQASNGNCNEEVVIPVTVFRDVTPDFAVASQTEFVGGSAVVVFDNTSNPIDADFRYEWDFGANAVPQTFTGQTPPAISYTLPGQKTVTLRVINEVAEAQGYECERVIVQNIEILVPPLVADFVAAPASGCAPLTVEIIENNSTGDIMNWEVLDETGRAILTSQEATPTFILNTPGEYEILLRTSNSITGQVREAFQDNINVYTVPLANFDTRPDVVFVPDQPLFTFNFSDGAESYSWDFGDGSPISTTFEPEHIYTEEGNYDVTLIAFNQFADGVICSDTLTRQVVAQIGGENRVPNAFTPSPFGPSRDGTIQNEESNDIFLPLTRGVEEFNMVIFDRWGNKIFESNNQNVGWDGYDKNGNLLPAGVYVYQLTLRLSNGERQQVLGDVMLIK